MCVGRPWSRNMAREETSLKKTRNMKNKIYPYFLHIPTFEDSFIIAYLKVNYLLITKRFLLN